MLCFTGVVAYFAGYDRAGMFGLALGMGVVLVLVSTLVGALLLAIRVVQKAVDLPAASENVGPGE